MKELQRYGVCATEQETQLLNLYLQAYKINAQGNVFKYSNLLVLRSYENSLYLVFDLSIQRLFHILQTEYEDLPARQDDIFVKCIRHQFQQEFYLQYFSYQEAIKVSNIPVLNQLRLLTQCRKYQIAPQYVYFNNGYKILVFVKTNATVNYSWALSDEAAIQYARELYESKGIKNGNYRIILTYDREVFNEFGIQQQETDFQTLLRCFRNGVSHMFDNYQESSSLNKCGEICKDIQLICRDFFSLVANAV